MFEVEIKAEVINLDNVLKFLTNSGFVVKKYFVKDIYLQHPCRDFSRTDEELRIRWQSIDDENVCVITYKGPSLSKDRSVREEIEIQINETLYDILKRLGFRDIIEKEKQGWLLEKGNIKISLINVRGRYMGKEVNLGNFIEIEIIVSNKRDINNAKARIMELYKKSLE